MAPEAEMTMVRAPDGPEPCVEVAGDDTGRTTLIDCGTPNARHLFRAWTDDAATRGIRLVGYDRPGYGGSTRHAGHSVADGAADVRAIADALGLERLAMWGFSG